MDLCGSHLTADHKVERDPEGQDGKNKSKADKDCAQNRIKNCPRARQMPGDPEVGCQRGNRYRDEDPIGTVNVAGVSRRPDEQIVDGAPREEERDHQKSINHEHPLHVLYSAPGLTDVGCVARDILA